MGGALGGFGYHVELEGNTRVMVSMALSTPTSWVRASHTEFSRIDSLRRNVENNLVEIVWYSKNYGKAVVSKQESPPKPPTINVMYLVRLLDEQCLPC